MTTTTRDALYLNMEQNFYIELEELIESFRRSGLKDIDMAAALGEYAGKLEQ